MTEMLNKFGGKSHGMQNELKKDIIQYPSSPFDKRLGIFTDEEDELINKLANPNLTEEEHDKIMADCGFTKVTPKMR